MVHVNVARHVQCVEHPNFSCSRSHHPLPRFLCAMAAEDTTFRLTFDKICDFDGKICDAHSKGAEDLKTLMERLTSQRVRARHSILKSAQAKDLI